MPKILLETKINAKIKIVFDFSLSVDLHQLSTHKTNETAIAGVTSGLMKMDETVTWRAKHFGIYQKLTTKITAFESPVYFSDEMIKGAFTRFKHQHFFESDERGTIMKDIFDYESPLGIFGKIADFLFLKKYMTRFLVERNAMTKEFAETEKWKTVLEVK